MNRGNKLYFRNLDGFRFIAFFLVFIQHSFSLPISIQDEYVYKIKTAIVGAGDVGVSFFFVLSGFLINYLILKEIDIRGKLNVFKFYIRRSLRIWPLYLTNITIGFFLYPFLKSFIGMEITPYANDPVWYYTFLSNFDFINVMKYFPGEDFIVLDVTWSIAVEEQFYFLIPILYLLFARKFSYLLNILVVAVSLIFRYLNSDDLLMLNFHTLGVMSDLAIGGLGAYIAFAQPKWFISIIKISKTNIRLIYFLGIIMLLHRIYIDEMFPVFNRLFYGLFFIFILLDQTFFKNRIYNMSNNKRMTNLGKYTYALYILHPWSIQAIIVIGKVIKWDYLSSSFNVTLANIGAFLISLVLSYLSYIFIERYFINLKGKFAYIHKS